MRSAHWLLITSCSLLVLLPLSCATTKDNPMSKPQCSDGKDNDGDGVIDFPDDPGCTSADDESEDSSALAQCSDGRDNDMDGKTDYPTDPGCFAAQQDDETDDCPSGPSCPQCSDGKDNDGNGQMDYPNDPGCSAAADNDEYTESPGACGSNVHIQQLPFDKHVSGMIMAGVSNVASPTCTGIGPEDVYELRLTDPKVVVADTSGPLNTMDTVLSIRSAMCTDAASEVVCNDDASTTVKGSSITKSLQPGTYYLIVDTKSPAPAGSYDLNVHYFAGEGSPCQDVTECGPGLACRIPMGSTTKVCTKHVCEDGVDDDGDGKNDYPTDPGCDTPQDDDEADTCPSGGTCPQCSNGIDDDADGKIDYPMDTQCLAASGAAESYCTGETDLPEVAVTSRNTPGTTIGKHNDFSPMCSVSNTAPDVTFSFALPVPVTTIQFDTNNSFDTVLTLRNAACTNVIACDDDSGSPGLESLITRPNMAAGNYSITVDGYSSNSGAFTLHVFGVVAAQKPAAVEKPEVRQKGEATPTALKPTPKIKPGDRLLIEVLEGLPGRPIRGERIVRPDGTVSLGFYGDILVAGLDRNEIKVAVINHLRRFLKDEVLGLTVVGPNGREFAVPSDESSRVFVDDSSNDDPGVAIETRVSQRLDRILASVEVKGGKADPAMLQRLNAQDQKLAEIERKLDRLLKAIEKSDGGKR